MNARHARKHAAGVMATIALIFALGSTVIALMVARSPGRSPAPSTGQSTITDIMACALSVAVASITLTVVFAPHRPLATGSQPRKSLSGAMQMTVFLLAALSILFCMRGAGRAMSLLATSVIDPVTQDPSFRSLGASLGIAALPLCVMATVLLQSRAATLGEIAINPQP